MKFTHWIPQYWRRTRPIARSTSEAGFTLLELLIAILIGGVIISSLMALVVEMLRLERRETAVDDVQRDMQRALDFIASDVSEAIFVYAPQKLSGETTTWDDNTTPAGETKFEAIRVLAERGEIDPDKVVLAFWRPDFIERNDDLPSKTLCGPDTKRTDLTRQEQDCRNLRERRGFFTLVVYQVIPNTEDNDNGIWKGQARIERYALPMYTDPENLERSAGFESDDGPIDINPTDDENINFFNWTPKGESIGGRSDVLVDFVADPTAGTEPECSDGLTAVPFDNTIRSFYTCVRNPGRLKDAENNLLALQNQNLEIHLQGDIASSGPLGLKVLGQNSTLPTLTTGVFVQGLIGYDPDSVDE